jgi:hypothetical protein
MVDFISVRETVAFGAISKLGGTGFQQHIIIEASSTEAFTQRVVTIRVSESTKRFLSNDQLNDLRIESQSFQKEVNWLAGVPLVGLTKEEHDAMST